MNPASDAMRAEFEKWWIGESETLEFARTQSDWQTEKRWAFAAWQAALSSRARVEAVALDGDSESVVAGRRCEIPLLTFKTRCERHLLDEQEKPNCDTALIGVLCEAVRLAREYADYVRSAPLPAPDGVVEAARAFIAAWDNDTKRGINAEIDALRAALRTTIGGAR